MKKIKRKFSVGISLGVIILLLAIIITVLIVGREKDFKLNRIIAEKFFQKGEYYYGGGIFDIPKAQKWYFWANVFDTKIPNLHYQLARTNLINSQFEKGIAEIKQELKNYPENKRSFYVKGLLDSYAERNDDAEEDFKQFIAWKPNGWAAYADLSWVQIKKEKYEEVIETTNVGLQYFSENPWLLSNQGLAHYRMEDYALAKTDLEKAKKLSEKLTADDWKKAYPGNDPQDATQGVADVQAIISYNLMLDYMKLGEIENYLKEKDNYNFLTNKK